METAAASQFEVPEIRLQSRTSANREVIRYVACIGNHLEAGDRRQLNNVGGWAGGIWVGHSEVEGAPTMRRTHHMVLQGLFVPLEMAISQKKADHREVEAHRESFMEGRHIAPGVRGYTVYPGDDIAYLQSDRFRPMGLVEITPLYGVAWSSELRKTLQQFFFPEWTVWQADPKQVPKLISDWETIVKAAQNRAQYESHEIIADELLTSIRLFREYASNQIEKNRQAIQSMRSTNTGGQFIGWHNKSRTYAEQLGIVLEDEKSILPAAADSPGLLAELREDRKLRLMEFEEQKRQNAILMAKILGEPIETVLSASQTEVANEAEPEILTTPEKIEELNLRAVETGYTEPAEPTAAIPVDDSEMDLAPLLPQSEVTPGCPELNGKGLPCKGKVYPGELKCVFHGGKKGE